MAVSTNFHELSDFDSDDDVIAKALDEDWDWCKSEFIGKDVKESNEKPIDWIIRCRAGLSVSDLTNQFWCEQQFEYDFLYPVSKPPTEVAAVGTSIHKERELEIHDIVEIEYQTKEDSWAIKLMNMFQQLLMLSSGHTVREFVIFGTLWNDVALINGIIDEINLNKDGKFEIRELKTRTKKGLPANSIQKKFKMQTMIYRKLLFDLIILKTGLNSVKQHVQLKWNMDLSNSVKSYTEELLVPCLTLNDVFIVLENFLEGTKFREFGSCVIEYFCQSTKETIGLQEFDYNEMWLKRVIGNQCDYLLGKRRPTGVDMEDAWKCHICDYQDVCSWRKRQDDKCREKNAQNFTGELGQAS